MIISLENNDTLEKYFPFRAFQGKYKGIDCPEKLYTKLKDICKEFDIENYLDPIIIIYTLFLKIREEEETDKKNTPDEKERIELLEYFRDIMDNKIDVKSIAIEGFQKIKENEKERIPRNLKLSTQIWINDIIDLLKNEYKEKAWDLFYLDTIKEIYEPPSSGRPRYSDTAKLLAKSMVNYLKNKNIIKGKEKRHKCTGKMLALCGYIKESEDYNKSIYNLFKPSKRE